MTSTLVPIVSHVDAGAVPRTPSDAAAEIGRKILGARKSRGLTQDELAAGSGIDSSNIRAYESGRSMPNVQSLVRIASVLGVAPGTFIDEVEVWMFAQPAVDGRRTRSVPQ